MEKQNNDQNSLSMYFFLWLRDYKVRYISISLSLTDLGDLCRLSLLMEFSISGIVYDSKSILLFPKVEVYLASIFCSES